MARHAHRHHQSYGPPYTGLHTGRRRNPSAGKLIIHRPDQPDEVISTKAFLTRARDRDEGDAGETVVAASR